MYTYTLYRMYSYFIIKINDDNKLLKLECSKLNRNIDEIIYNKNIKILNEDVENNIKKELIDYHKIVYNEEYNIDVEYLGEFDDDFDKFDLIDKYRFLIRNIDFDEYIKNYRKFDEIKKKYIQQKNKLLGITQQDKINKLLENEQHIKIKLNDLEKNEFNDKIKKILENEQQIKIKLNDLKKSEFNVRKFDNVHDQHEYKNDYNDYAITNNMHKKECIIFYNEYFKNTLIIEKININFYSSDLFPELLILYDNLFLTSEQINNIKDNSDIYESIDDIKYEIKDIINNKPNDMQIIKYIHDNYEITKNIEDKILFSNLFEIIKNDMKLNDDYVVIIKRKLSYILKELNLQKKRFSKGIYWYGLKRKINNDITNKIFEKNNSDIEQKFTELTEIRNSKTSSNYKLSHIYNINNYQNIISDHKNHNYQSINANNYIMDEKEHSEIFNSTRNNFWKNITSDINFCNNLKPKKN